MGSNKHAVNLSNFMEAFNNRFGDKFEYVSGYVKCESRIMVRCRMCGNEFDVCAQVVRRPILGTT